MKFFYASLVALGCICFSAFAADETKPLAADADLLHRLDAAYVGVFEKVAPAVVIIEANKKQAEEDSQNADGLDLFFRDPNGDGGSRRHFRMPQQVRSEGSGFIIRPNGFVLTNFHVIEDAEKIEVKLKDGRHFPAKLIGSDDKTDIAILKIEATNLPSVEMADSDAVRVGQQCFAIGIPYNLDYSFSRGLVSAKGRSNLTGTPNKPMYEDYIQTDAMINPGNSGGPLFDINGRVIGMNTLINGIGRGLAFAIPSNMLIDVGEQLIANGKVTRPWLGIRIETLGDNANLREHIHGIDKGVVVDTIEPETPAYKSDLRPADVITAVDGVALATARDLQKEILKKKVGQPVELSVWRNGKSIKIAVTTGELPSDVTKVANKTVPKSSPASAEAYGMSVRDAGRQPGEKSKTKTAAGVVVTSVEPGSPADEAGIKTDDLIAEVDEKPVANLAEFRKVLSSHNSTSSVLMLIERKGQKTYAVIKQTSSQDTK